MITLAKLVLPPAATRNRSLLNIRELVFERRTATGNETFSLFTRLGATTFVILSVFTRIETIYLKIRAHPLPKNEKRPLPVAVRRSKTSLLKLSSTERRRRLFPFRKQAMPFLTVDAIIGNQACQN